MTHGGGYTFLRPYLSECCGAVKNLCWARGIPVEEYPDETDVICDTCGRVATHYRTDQESSGDQEVAAGV